MEVLRREEEVDVAAGALANAVVPTTLGGDALERDHGDPPLLQTRDDRTQRGSISRLRFRDSIAREARRPRST